MYSYVDKFTQNYIIKTGKDYNWGENMAELLSVEVLNKKSEMYAMVISIEEDFVSNFKEKLTLQDIPTDLVKKAKIVREESNEFVATLRGLDIQSYIEICNANINKLNINFKQKSFINAQLGDIIPIRNNVMHPRPIGFFDYPKLKTVFENISNELNCFSWDNVKKTQFQIENYPETLLPPPHSLKKSERIIENIPSMLDYEDTSFVGRNREIGEIRAQLNRRNVNILSIIGDGGVGKTATTLKLLYDMLDDPDCKFELIIWTSLKTNELSDSDFQEIVDSIKTTSQMYEQLAPFVASETVEDTKKFIIELAQNLNTLFVLDNLETLNTADIKDFIDEFSEYGKVLITSRIGLGEMEHRYKLSGLNEEDVLEYTDRLLELYGFECFFTNEHKKDLVVNKLHSNPLAIKWFVRCLYNGQSEEEILSHKEDVINFCMANVYEKLSDDAHQVLNVLTIAGVQLSFPELMYYLEGEIADCTKVKYAINELGKCNFIDEEKFRRDKNVAITEFAHEFLMLRYSDVKHMLKHFKELQQKLSAFGQQLLIKRSEDAFNINAIHYQNKAELVAAKYLTKAIEVAPDDMAFEWVRYSQELAPQYYENNLVLAHLYGTSSPLKATQEYENALKYCISDEERVRVRFSYANFLIRMNDYQQALEIVNIAEKLNAPVLEVKLQKAKVLSYVGQYELAEQVLNEISSEPVSNIILNRIQTRRADIHRRRSELIDIRETQKRLVCLKMSFCCLEECIAPDRNVFEYMAKILEELTYMYMDEDALSFILEIVEKTYQNIKKTSHYKEFRIQMKQRLPQIQNEEFKKKISRYITDYNLYLHLLEENEAVIYSLKEGYGFCKNITYPQGLYFSMKGMPQDIDYGDILSFSSVLDSKNKLSVVFPKRTGKISDRILVEESSQ